LLIRPSKNSQTDTLKVFQPFYLNHFYFSVLPGNSPVTLSRDSAGVFSDTITWGNNTLYQNKQVTYPPSLFNRTIRLKKGDLYSNAEVESAFNAFNRLRQFRFVDIQFKEVPLLSDKTQLDCYIMIAPLTKASTPIGMVATSTAGNFRVDHIVPNWHRMNLQDIQPVT